MLFVFFVDKMLVFSLYKLHAIALTRSPQVLTRAGTRHHHRALQVPVCAKRKENREGGAIPPRAQRCKDDDAGGRPLTKVGKVPASGESESEDRPEK